MGALPMQGKNPFTPTDQEISEKFDIDTQFDLYLKLVKLDKRRMSPVQLKETRQAFYAAFGQCLLLLHEATVYDEKDAHRVFDCLTAQVSKHFTQAVLPKN